ncbi:RICIN domain-containing protein [Amycolatopsis sp. GA6-003]|uniref:RICIN domain-containing protein n=1 Tax=Amycolatopsis sp. GA6-003 TaxID=2652444 RepID=UPI003917436E
MKKNQGFSRATIACLATATTGIGLLVAGPATATVPKPGPLPADAAHPRSAPAAQRPGEKLSGVMIVWTGNNLCLTVRGANPGPGAAVSTEGCTGSPEQRWSFEGNGTIKSELGTCLDIDWNNAGRGAGVNTWTCYGGDAQQFHTEGASLRNLDKNCLDVSFGNTWLGASVQMWQCDGGGTQAWRVG